MNPRERAYEALMEVEHKGAYSNLVLTKYMKDKNIEQRDRGFITELVYGTLENKMYLDHIIESMTKRPCSTIDKEAHIILRMGLYQIIFLNSVTDFAAVNEMVNLIKKKNPKAQGFVNGVLRNFLRNPQFRNVDTKLRGIARIAVEHSFEKWILERWKRDYDQEFVEEIVEAFQEKPEMYLRTNTLKIERDDLIKELEKEGVKAEKVHILKDAVKVNAFKNLDQSEAYKKGYFQVQDISSMLVGNIVSPKPGEKICDVCSAPGGKTSHMAAIMKNEGQIVARDVFEHKLSLMSGNFERLGISIVSLENKDATNFSEEDRETFDRVLVDAPCSGFGIIRRKPEIKHKKEEEVRDLPKLQLDILKNSAKMVKSGGVLVYSTCTIGKAENIDVVMKFLEENEEFKLEPINEVNIDKDMQKEGYLEIYPHIHGMDGFFISKMRKVLK